MERVNRWESFNLDELRELERSLNACEDEGLVINEKISDELADGITEEIKKRREQK